LLKGLKIHIFSLSYNELMAAFVPFTLFFVTLSIHSIRRKIF